MKLRDVYLSSSKNNKIGTDSPFDKKNTGGERQASRLPSIKVILKVKDLPINNHHNYINFIILQTRIGKNTKKPIYLT